MKVASILVILSILFSFFTSHDSIRNREKQSTGYLNVKTVSPECAFEATDDDNYHTEKDGYVIYGNYTEFDSSLLYSLTHEKNKICIFYDLDLSDNANDKHEIMRNNAVIYYYKNNIPYVHSYKSNSTEAQSLINDINIYVNEVLSEMNGEDNIVTTKTDFLRYSPYTTGNEIFEVLYVGSFREEEKPYGYIDCNYTVRKYRANDVSSLYLVEARVFFTPGSVAHELGGTDYENWKNLSGFVKLKALRASNEVGINQVRYGGTPVYKDAYPVNTPRNITIASSYSQGINLGVSGTFGFSFEDIVNGGIEGDLNENVAYAYSKAYQNTEPALSAQKDPDDVEKFTWLYTYSSPKGETNNFQLGYMFEMNNSGHDLLEGDLALQFEYQMTVDKLIVFIHTKQSFSGSAYHNYY